MKVARVATYAVDSGHAGWLFVKVESDEPTLHGWGEASLPFKINSVKAEVEVLADVIIGEDAFRTEHLWQLMYRQHSRGGLITSSAIAGIDQALWDLKARALGVPLYELLGGRVRERVRVYDHIETEWQFESAVSPQRWLRGVALPDGFVLGAPAARDIADTYYDTEDWRLYRAGYALRVRQTGHAREATLKELGAAREGRYERRELSSAVTLATSRSASDGAQPHGIVERLEGVLADRLNAVAGTHPVRPVLELRTRRRGLPKRL